MRLRMLAERYFPEDPNTCLLKLRQLAEGLAARTVVPLLVQGPEGPERPVPFVNGLLREHRLEAEGTCIRRTTRSGA